MTLTDILSGIRNKVRNSYVDSQISRAKQEDGKYKLVLVGYKVRPKKDNTPNNIPKDFETSTISFSNEDGLLLQIQTYKDGGQLLDVGRPEKGEYTYFIQINPDCLKEKDWFFPINREFIGRFGKIEMIIFNWGGVIADDRKAAHAATDKMLGEYGHKGMSILEWILKKNSDPIGFLVSQGIKGDPKEIEQRYRELYDNEKKTTNRPVLYPQVRGIVRYLTEMKKTIAILSKFKKNDLINEAVDFHLINDVPFVFQDANNKTMGLLSLCEVCNQKPQNVLYVDDTADGIVASQNAGVHSAGILTGYGTRAELEAEKPEFMLLILDDLKKYVH
ncbi:MAG: HAD hydrolase-like protein [Kiritimatiellae bacterium]|nr:HAD hydrolase-like protein [Kiritimatiellia bacterium]